jgi:hypothetical protein
MEAFKKDRNRYQDIRGSENMSDLRQHIFNGSAAVLSLSASFLPQGRSHSLTERRRDAIPETSPLLAMGAHKSILVLLFLCRQ